MKLVNFFVMVVILYLLLLNIGIWVFIFQHGVFPLTPLGAMLILLGVIVSLVSAGFSTPLIRDIYANK